MGTNQRSTVQMTDEEVAAFLAAARTATLATIGTDGRPHLVAMWYALVDGRVGFETKAKSQKAANLRRDARVTCMIETGDTYDALRGVAIDGVARVVDDTDDPDYWRVAESVFERYQGGTSSRRALEVMMNNRIAVIVEPTRIRSWDHRKLGIRPMPIAGTTAGSAEHLRRAP